MYKVFLADDEVVVREGIRSSFPWETSNFVLAGEAPDGEIALSLLREIKPDILITDIRMPFMDGLELCRQTRAQLPWVKTIILTGYDEFTYAKEALALGVKEYLLKPVSAQELDAAITVGGAAKFRSRMALAVDNTILNTNVELPGMFQDDYWTYDARVVWSDPASRYTVGLYGQNLSDKVYKTDAQEFSTVGGIRTAYYGAPRTWMLKVSARY